MTPLSRRLSQAEHALAADFTRKLRRLLLAAVLSVAGILALIHWPAYTAALVCIGGPCAILGKVLIDCRAEAEEYNEEHDL